MHCTENNLKFEAHVKKYYGILLCRLRVINPSFKPALFWRRLIWNECNDGKYFYCTIALLFTTPGTPSICMVCCRNSMISSGCPAMVVAWDGISATLFSLLLTKLFYFGYDAWQFKQKCGRSRFPGSRLYYSGRGPILVLYEHPSLHSALKSQVQVLRIRLN